MVDHHLGLEETDDGIWVIHVNMVLLATFDERECRNGQLANRYPCCTTLPLPIIPAVHLQQNHCGNTTYARRMARAAADEYAR